jgi:glycosyltransferase 2 family protein
MRAASSSRAPRALSVVLKVAVSVGLLALLFSWTDLTAVAVRLRHMDARWLGLAVGFFLTNLLVCAWRWQLLLETQRVHPPLRGLFGSYLVATFFNNFLPSNIGGDVVRVADTAPLTGSRTVATGVILVDRLIGLGALVAVAAVGSVLARHGRMPVPGASYLWIALVGFVAIGVPMLYHPHVVTRLLGPLRLFHPEWVEERLQRIHDLLEQMGRRRGALFGAAAGAIAVQILLVLMFLAIARGLQIPLRPLDTLIIVPLSLVAQLLPISINGLGVREAVFAYFFSRLGLTVDAALALSLASAALVLGISLAGGLTFLLRRGLMVAPSRSDTR